MTTVSEALAAAMSHHQHGELAQAAAISRRIVEVDPLNADAWHLLGVVAHQEGRSEESVEAISRAIALDAGQAAYHSHLGAAYAGLSRMDEAESSLRRALALCQTDAQIHYNLAVLLNLREKPSEAIDHYRRAIELNPRMAEACFNLANLLRDRDDWRAAETSYLAALAVRPNYLKALVNLAAAYTKQWKTEQAEAVWRQVLESRRQALAGNPQDVEAHTGLGAALQGLGRTDEAKDSYRRALALKPGDRAARYNMGSALLTEGDYREAEGYFRAVTTSEPDYADAHFRLGQCLQFEGQFDAAVASYDRAIALMPADAEFHYYRATTRLTSGDFARGWPEYEWRLKTRYAGPAYPQPRWHGEELRGQGIVVYAEWGFGDTVHFVRYLPWVEQRGGKVYLAVQPGLIPLLEESGFRQVIEWRDDPLPQCQWRVPLLSLPGIFNTGPDTIPAPIPYLSASPKLVEKWRGRIGSLAGFKIGIHWHGSKAWATDLRSIPLVEFEPLARVPGVTLVSLQKNDNSGQLRHLGDRFAVVDFGDELDAADGAFMDTAAIMKQLDLVITCDTSIAHVAGALGVPVWVALPRGSEWRWQWNRSDSPWYPTMTLFRQPKFGEWHRVFQEMGDQLTRIVPRGDNPA